jgi:ApaG protein
MATALTKGVKISVETTFRPDLTDAENQILFFNYAISIENQNPFKVQLLKRHWRIFDALNFVREISGEGVIGEQPVIEPGETHTYQSGCDLNSELGQMTGNYDFVILDESNNPQDHFKVEVPVFKLEFPPKLN